MGMKNHGLKCAFHGFSLHCCGWVKKMYAFDGLSNKKCVADIQKEMSIDQSKANLDEKILFAKTTHL